MPDSPSEHDVAALATALVGAALDAAIAELGAAQPRQRERERALIPAMNLVCDRLGVHLTRWVGADGWKALLRRSLDEVVRTGNPTGLSQDAEGALRWSDDAPLSQVHTSCVQVLVAVTGVLARFIGDEMAMRLIEQGLAQDGESGQGPHHG